MGKFGLGEDAAGEGLAPEHAAGGGDGSGDGSGVVPRPTSRALSTAISKALIVE
jgi:hypothetical protein